MKTCSKCGETKPDSEFYTAPSFVCKGCKRSYSHSKYAPLKKETKLKRSQSYNSSGQKRCKKCGKYQNTSEYSPHPTHWDRLDHICKSCHRADYFEHRSQRTDKSKPAQREWYTKNKDKKQKQGRAWRQNNRDKAHIIWHRYKSKKYNAPCTLTDQEWKDILDQYSHSCAYCHASNVSLQKEHKIPVSRGGGFTKENIIPSCKSCNSRKGAMTYDEFIDHLHAVTL